MIFVTVGSYDFEHLIKTVDKCAPNFNEKFICQIGRNTYKPQNCEYFRYRDTLDPYYKDASLVITHGGAGTLFRTLELGKKIIGVDNFACIGSHQKDLLKKLADDNHIIWCDDLRNLEKLIKDLPNYQLKRYTKPLCLIANTIEEYIDGK